jgi:hypothetical protein
MNYALVQYILTVVSDYIQYQLNCHKPKHNQSSYGNFILILDTLIIASGPKQYNDPSCVNTYSKCITLASSILMVALTAPVCIFQL